MKPVTQGISRWPTIHSTKLTFLTSSFVQQLFTRLLLEVPLLCWGKWHNDTGATSELQAPSGWDGCTHIHHRALTAMLGAILKKAGSKRRRLPDKNESMNDEG